MPRIQWSSAVYRLMLLAYPREFRERFARDMQSDVEDLARMRGAWCAWRRTLVDFMRSVPYASWRWFESGERNWWMR